MTLRCTAACLIRVLAACGWTSLCTERLDAQTRDSQAEKPPQAAIHLFNGKNLDGWTPKIRGHKLGENVNDTFRVENGILKVSYEKYKAFDGAFGHLFYVTPFAHYRLVVEYRFVGEQCPGGPGWAFRNSGIMIHGQLPETMALDQSFPVSIEVQLLGGDGTNPRPTANVCTPGTHVVMGDKLVTRHCNDAASETFHGDQWVTVEVEVDGSRRITHRVNGEEVLTYSKPQLDPNDSQAKPLIRDGNLILNQGSISLQAESHPVEFRRVDLTPLDP